MWIGSCLYTHKTSIELKTRANHLGTPDGDADMAGYNSCCMHNLALLSQKVTKALTVQLYASVSNQATNTGQAYKATTRCLVTADTSQTARPPITSHHILFLPASQHPLPLLSPC